MQPTIEVVKGSNGKTCTVLCKLPSGIHMDIPGAEGEPTKRVIVRGTSAGAINYESGDPLFAGRMAIGGFGVTEDVSEEFFDEWLKRNRNLQLVRSKLILKAPNAREAMAMGKDNAARVNKLEPIDPAKPTTEGSVKIEKYKKDGDG